jgi:hypothetical protein
MGKCECGKPEGIKGSGVCAMCAKKGVKSTTAPKITSYQRKEQEKNARVKKQMEEELEKRKPEMEAMAARATLIQQKADEKKKAIATIVADWTAQVMAIVTQVRALRTANPGITGINAGLNAVGNTLGGNGKHATNRAGDPLRLQLPANDHDITKAEVFAKMNGFDGSDSADLKIRIIDPGGNILVHVW